MIPVIPLAVAGVLAVVAFAMASKDEGPKLLPPGPTPGPEPTGGGATTPAPTVDSKPTGTTPAGAQPATTGSAPAGDLPPGTAINTGDKGTVHADDAFDEALAGALARKDVAALELLAAQAEKMGLLSVARSIRDEIGRIKNVPLPPTPPLPDKPPLTNKLATYVVQSGDTGEKIAEKFVHAKNRWPELVTVNPTLKDPKYGLKIYAGQRINLPASWPTGIPVLPPTPVPTIAPKLPAAPPALNSYTVIAGDTGEKVAAKFTGSKGRWPELLTVNPTLKSAQYGIALYTGHKINLPASWPAAASFSAGVSTPAPVAAPAPVVTPTGLNTYLVVSGDTGEKVATKFTGNKSRWPELLTVNPTLKSAQYGIALYAGKRINLPASWPATPMGVPPLPTAPPPVALPPAPVAAQPMAESDSRTAAREITAYLTGLGGLAGRYKESQPQVKVWQSRMGGTAVPADGKYGTGSATAVMVEGFVPVAPYYWSATNTAAKKAAFIKLIDNYAAADPQRATQWAKLKADTIRS